MRLPALLLLGLVAAALIGGVTLVWQTIVAERHQRETAASTNAVLIALRDVSRTAVNAETGQRGYFISLDRRYLAPYLVAREQRGPNIARLRAASGHGLTAQQSDLLDRIEMLDAARFADLEESVKLIDQGNLLEARRRILTDEGQDVMERLRRTVAEMEMVELATYTDARARAEEAEARIVPMLVVLLIFIVLTLGLGVMQVIRTADAEARAGHAAELALARDRADLLARELNHRVKNLFAVVLAIVKMTGRDHPEAKPVVDRIAERIHALLTAHEVTQGTSAHRSANLADLVETTLRPYRSPENGSLVDGPAVDLPERAVVPLGLVLHELTTNAVKYGAWAHPGGRLAVRWSVAGDRLHLDWQEHCSVPCADEPPTTRGFGTTLIDGSARQLGGTIDRRFEAQGIRVLIDISLAA